MQPTDKEVLLELLKFDPPNAEEDLPYFSDQEIDYLIDLIEGDMQVG